MDITVRHNSLDSFRKRNGSRSITLVNIIEYSSNCYYMVTNVCVCNISEEAIRKTKKFD